MAIKLVDELKAMGNFPIAHAEGINLVKTDGTEDNLQNLFDNGELGGGDSSVTLTQQEYEALSEEQKLDGLYYTYDTKRIYKNGVQYGASDAEDIGYNNAGSGIQATTVQGAIDKVVKIVEDDYAKTTDIPTTLPANGGNADTVNNHTVKSDVPENAVFTDTVYDDTEINAKLGELSSNLGEKVDYKVVVEDGTRYVEDIVVQDINTWLPNNNSSIVVNLKKANGANYSNFQLLCNKQDSKNWTCIVIGGISTFWRICYVNGVRYIEEIATMDKVGTTQIIGFKTNLLNQCYGYYTIGNNKVSVHMKFVLSSALGDWETLTNANLPAPSSAVTKNANGKTGVSNSVYINTEGKMQQGGGGGMSAGTYEFDFEYTTA